MPLIFQKTTRIHFSALIRGPRASWQLLVQREPNGIWGWVNKYSGLVASENVTEVNLLLLAEHVKERSGASSEISRFHAQGYGEASIDSRRRESQNLSNRMKC
jgi:hypothetical protein